MRFNHSDLLWAIMKISPIFVPFLLSIYHILILYYQSGVNIGLSGARETLLFSVLICRATNLNQYVEINSYLGNDDIYNMGRGLSKSFSQVETIGRILSPT